MPNLSLRNDQLRTLIRGQPNEALIHDLLVDSEPEPSTFLKRLAAQFSESYKGHYRVVTSFKRRFSPTLELNQGGSGARLTAPLCGYYGTALQAASAEGHKGVVQILLNKNADINAEGRHYRTAAVTAASKGGVKVMQLLLSREKDVNITADVARAAAGNGGSEKRVMALLLEKRGDEAKITADMVKAAAENP